jgi:hypothetical protein
MAMTEIGLVFTNTILRILKHLWPLIWSLRLDANLSDLPSFERPSFSKKIETREPETKPRPATSGSFDNEVRDQLIAAQRKLLIFYEEEWDGPKPPPIEVRVYFYHCTVKNMFGFTILYCTVFNVDDKSYRQVLTPINNSQLLLKLEILDKFRLVQQIKHQGNCNIF